MLPKIGATKALGSERQLSGAGRDETIGLDRENLRLIMTVVSLLVRSTRLNEQDYS